MRLVREAAETGSLPDDSSLDKEEVEHLIHEFGVYQA